MAVRTGFRRVNEKLGLFVIVCLALAVLVVVLTSRAHRWFGATVEIVLILPEEGSFGLRRGADVQVLGTVVGQVETIMVSDAGQMEAIISVREDFGRFVRNDSDATIKKRFGMAGDAFVEISRGRGEPLDKENATLRCGVDEGPTELLNEVITQIRGEAIPAIRELRAAVVQYAELAAALRDPDGPVQKLLTRSATIAGQVEQGEGVVGRLVMDPEWANQLSELWTKLDASITEAQVAVKEAGRSASAAADIAESVRSQMEQLPQLVTQTQQVLEETQAILKSIRQTTDQTPRLIQAVSDQVEALPGLVIQTQQTLREIERLVEGLQSHWLIRGYVEPDQPTARIAPDQVGPAGEGSP